MSFDHASIWTGIEQLALRYRVSLARLAQIAGLNPTAFNSSKRIAPNGRPRWPSTESVSRALEAVGCSFVDFAMMVESAGQIQPQLPTLGLSEIDLEESFLHNGKPIKDRWRSEPFVATNDADSYALLIDRELKAGILTRGTRLIVSPAASVKPGNLVLIGFVSGMFHFGTLKKQTVHRIEIQSINEGTPVEEYLLPDIAWYSRIIMIGL